MREKNIQYKIIKKSIISIVLLSILFSIYFYTIIYNYLKEDQFEKNVSTIMETEKKINNVIEKYENLALQINSRTMIRNKLEAYNNGDLNLNEITEYTKPKLEDAFIKIDNLKSLIRISKDSKVVTWLGKKKVKIENLISNNSGNLEIKTIKNGEDSLILINSKIINRSGEIVGSDILIFDLKEIKDIINEIDDPVNIIKDNIKIINNNKARNTDDIHIESQKSKRYIVYEENIKKLNWEIHLLINKAKFYNPVFKEITKLSIFLLLIIILGIISSYLISSPLAGKILMNKKELEKEIESKTQKIKKEALLKDRIYKIIGHDLKSPLSGIYTTIEILNEDWDFFSKKQKREFLDESMISIVKINDLLSNLLEWVNLDTYKINKNEIINIKEEFLNLKSLYLDSLNIKDIELKIKVPQNIKLKTNERIFLTIMRNLISNAMKFTEKGGTITLSVKKEKDKIIVIVSDTGIGISKTKLKEILSSDKITSTKGTNDELGTGFGLIAVRDFAESLGCILNINSQEGKGTDIQLIF